MTFFNLIKHTFVIFFMCVVCSLSAQTSDRYQSFKSQCKKWQAVNLDSALYYANAMMKVADSIQDYEKISESILWQGLAYGYMDDFENEIKYYRKAFAYSSLHDDSLGIGKAYINMGVNHFYSGRLDSAAIYYELSRKVFQSINEERFLGFSLNNLGQVYTRVEKYDKAKEAYNEALKVKMSQKDTVAIMNTYFNLASLCISENEFEEALDYSKQTLIYAQQVGDSMNIGSAQINLGLSSMRIGDYEDAFNYIEVADSYIDALKKDPELILDLHSLAAELFVEKQNWGKAKERLIRMKEFIRDDAFPNSRMKYYQLKGQIEKNEKDYKNALSSLEDYIKVRDEYVSESVQKNISQLEKKYESEQKERVITELELEQKNAALAFANSQNQRNLFISGFTILIIFAGFLFQRYTSKKNTSELLTKKNIEVTQALEDRETLLKEIHHRVKNNLQVISSLLNLQAGSLDDEAAIDAVKEGQNRVKSMALIHQRLYSADDIRGVDIHDYIENLVSELFTAFGVDTDRVSSSVRTQKLKMDIDTVIPLGLILNELITNSLKYAFAGTDHGQLDIEMKEIDNILQVIVRDNGIGMNEETMRNSNSFGWKMIQSLSRKLKAEIIVKNDQGTIVYLNLSRYKLVV